MRKYLIFSFLFALALAAYGCGDTEDKPVSEVGSKCLTDAPDWVLGNAEGGLSAVGAAQLSKAGLNYARNAAMANARDEMTRTIEVKVNNMVKDFTQVTGIGD
ncbi:MAG: hypothetical protein LBP51_08490, partial [Deferribacteraceae bacterium]|nr:hypothetical protein [Deferribacteraceae bacterium]